MLPNRLLFSSSFRALIAVIGLCLAAASARAQSVFWRNNEGSPGRVFELVFENCEPESEPTLPAIPNATLAYAGTATNVNMNNFNITRSVTLTYVAQPRRGGGPIRIPSFTIKTNKGAVTVPAFDGAAPAVSADTVASARLTPDRNSVWAGEVFQLSYRITAPRRLNPQFNDKFEWAPAPLTAEAWSPLVLNEAAVNGQPHLIVTGSTRAIARQPGSVQIEPTSHLVHVQVGQSFGLFSAPRMEPVSVTSDQPTVEVRPLPAPPAGYAGAVGEFKLTSKIVPLQATVGDPITWTLELTGTGNWPDLEGLPARDVSKDFQVVQPKAKRTLAEGKLFDATLTEDVVLIPTKPGTYTLNAVAFTFFNPRTGQYETARTERAVITVAATAASPSTPAVQNEKPKTDAPSAPTSKAVVAAPSAPATLPLEPLPGQGDAARPLSRATLVTWAFAPFALLLGFWLYLAALRAKKTDPSRPQREAHAQLQALLADLRRADDGRMPPTAAQLLEWQRQSAIVWRIAHAAPPASALERPWSDLWQEADRALYGRDAALPRDWIARAEEALAAKRPPAFNPLRLFLPRNLLPFAALLALALALPPSPARAADTNGKPVPTLSPETNYRAGNFAAAEGAWRDAVKANPRDWIARHNLALALAQQERAGEAAAQAAAAFVQQPNHPSVRWHFALSTHQAGFAPAGLGSLSADGPQAALATLASPSRWQRILIGACFILAAALAWLLHGVYGGRNTRGRALAGFSVAGLAALVAGAALFGQAAYGETADERAVLTFQPGVLRSIPTEADVTQKTTTLPAGSVARAQKTFLTWNQLQFANGQTGWVRQDEVVPIWR